MSHAPVQFDLADTSDSAFDVPIEAMLVATIAFGAFAFGAVHAWAEMVVFVLAFAMVIVLAVKLIRRRDVPFVWSSTYVPIALFVTLVLFQLVPMPPTLVRAISPHTYALKMQLLGDLPADRLRWMTITFNAEATIHDLKVLLAVIAVHVVVINCIRRMSQVRRVLVAIGIIGGAMAILALVQDASGTDHIYWLFPNPSGRVARGGAFVNRSHFGQFMNLSIGAALGALLVFVHQHFRRDHYTPDEMKTKLRAPEMRLIWTALAVCAISMASVALSLSRGAMLAAAIAGATVMLAVVTRRGARGRGFIIFVLVLCVASVVLLDFKTIIDRIRVSAGEWQGNRLEILRDLRVAWKDFPIFGIGLGSFAVFFPMLDRSSWPMFATHAENEYAQVLTETGVIGLTLAIVFIVMITRAAIRAIRSPMSTASSMALGLCFGWIAIVLHSATDFGQHLPAIAMLTATITALLLNLAQQRSRELNAALPDVPVQRGRIALRGVALVAVALIAIGVLHDQTSAREAESAWSVVKRIDAHLQRKRWAAENVEYADVILAAERAATLRPRNVEYQYWLNFYRWKSIARVRDQRGGAPLPSTQRAFAERIVEELHRARPLAPTYGRLSLLAGEIERFELDQVERGRRDIERAFTLCGPDPTAAFLLGQMQAIDGQIEESMANLRRAVLLNPDIRVEVSDVYLRQLNRPEIALEVAGDDLQTLDALVELWDKRVDDPAAKALSARARAKASEVLERDAAKGEASPELIARHAATLADRGDHERAVTEYRRALSKKFGDTDWRLALARSLEKLGRRDEALREVEGCLRRRPRMPEALDMMERLKSTKR